MLHQFPADPSPPAQKVVHAHVTATHAALAREGPTAVEDAPVVEDDGIARAQREGDFVLVGQAEDARPGAGRGVPGAHSSRVREAGQRGAVVVVPTDLGQIFRVVATGRVVEDRPAGDVGRVVHDHPGFAVAAGVADHRHAGEDRVRVPVDPVQVFGRGEAVHEHRFSACPVGVREHVEHLQPARIGEVGGVGVCRQRQGRICRVDRVGDGSEVPEGAVVGGADEGDAVEKGFRSLGRGWSPRSEAQAVGADFVQIVQEACRGGHDGLERNGWIGRRIRVGVEENSWMGG